MNNSDPNDGITDADLQVLLSINPLASEQLRRIIAERKVVELQAKIRQNGTVADEVEAVVGGG
tara:strand:- start:1464 stop:1652 length:189 start_codon:yes stop_codon:yes gene_type:complete